MLGQQKNICFLTRGVPRNYLCTDPEAGGVSTDLQRQVGGEQRATQDQWEWCVCVCMCVCVCSVGCFECFLFHLHVQCEVQPQYMYMYIVVNSARVNMLVYTVSTCFYIVRYVIYYAWMISHSTAVIGWLNKQINEQMMGGVRGPVPSSSLPLSTIRHSSPLTFSSSSAPPHTHHLVGSVLLMSLSLLLASTHSRSTVYNVHVQYAPKKVPTTLA